jgi:hypothetical protein
MDLLNLPEHILVKVCRYSDFKSKLNLMSTCKFFNDFIGKNPEFCKNFKLVIKDEIECQSGIGNFTHRVSDIDLQIVVNRENFAEILALLTSIGQTVVEIKFYRAELQKHFWELLNLIPNVEKLDLSEFLIQGKEENLPSIPHKFKKLKTLKLSIDGGLSESLLDIFKDVTSLEELEIKLIN